MKLCQKKHSFATSGRGFIEITAELQNAVADSGIQIGLCHCYIHHTSASLVITENADSDVLSDLNNFMNRLVVDGDPCYLHRAEGADGPGDGRKASGSRLGQIGQDRQIRAREL